MPDLVLEVLRWMCVGCGLAAAEPGAQAEPVVLHARTLPVEASTAAPRVAELTLQGAEPVAEFKPRMLPVPTN